MKKKGSPMYKRIICLLFFCVIGVSLFSCGMNSKKAVPLSKDEEELIEMVEDDMNIVTDDSYVDTVGELLYHTDQFSGQIYQLEGVYSVEEDQAYLSRTLINGEEKTICSIPLKYLQKDIEPNSWIRVTGIINQGEVDGENKTVLEVVAIEALAKQGKAELSWNGSFEHQH